MQPKPSPLDSTVGQVIAAFPKMVDPNSDQNAADPYVVALALERRADGFSVCVVADDAVIQEACAGFGVVVEAAAEFVSYIRA